MLSIMHAVRVISGAYQRAATRVRMVDQVRRAGITLHYSLSGRLHGLTRGRVTTTSDSRRLYHQAACRAPCLDPNIKLAQSDATYPMILRYVLTDPSLNNILHPTHFPSHWFSPILSRAWGAVVRRNTNSHQLLSTVMQLLPKQLDIHT